MILEPLMMNAGMIHPEPGYLAGLRDLLHDHGALLTFDEVKTGLTVGPGGVTAASGVTPDIVCLAKAIGGGVSAAAIGGTEELMGLIADGTLRAGRHVQRQPARDGRRPGDADRGDDAAAYAHLERLAAAWPTGSRRSSRARPAVARGHRRREGLHRVPRRSRSATSATSSTSTTGSATPHWLVQHNGGVFLPPWGKIEQWLISVQHTDDDVDRFVANCRPARGRVAATGPT